MLRSLLLVVAALQLTAAEPPAVGQKAPDFTLSNVSGKSVRFSEQIAKGPVVLVVLRGYPGYQCPFCNRQVQDLIKNAKGFTDAGARVVMIYPGPSLDLGTRANEFLTGKQLPETFEMLLDPDYKFTILYNLRWDAPKETAYPSTFLVDKQGTVFFSKVSKGHGGRTSADEILKALRQR